MYFRLDWKVTPPDHSLANTDTCPELDIPWTMGIKYPDTLPEPIICPLHPKRGRTMRDMFLTDIPLFSDKLITCLLRAGVDNFDTYVAELHSPEGKVYTNYRAVNIIGTVGCANLDKSIFLPNTEPPMIAFSHLVIDEQRALNRDLFRLAENTLYILVSQRIKKALDIAGCVGIRLEAVESNS